MKKPNIPSLPKVDFKAFIEEFRNLNPKDVGTWPALPRFTILFAVFAVILTAGWWFVWDGQLTELENKRKEELQFREDWVSKKKQAVNLDLYQAQKLEVDRVFGALLKQLPGKTDIEALLVEINQAGLGRGLQFELFRPGAESSREFYAELPITIRLTGQYHDLGVFASDIGRLSRIVTLNNISLTPLPGGMALDALTLTYRALDENELANQKKSTKPGGKK